MALGARALSGTRALCSLPSWHPKDSPRRRTADSPGNGSSPCLLAPRGETGSQGTWNARGDTACWQLSPALHCPVALKSPWTAAPSTAAQLGSAKARGVLSARRTLVLWLAWTDGTSPNAEHLGTDRDGSCRHPRTWSSFPTHWEFPSGRLVIPSGCRDLRVTPCAPHCCMYAHRPRVQKAQSPVHRASHTGVPGEQNCPPMPRVLGGSRGTWNQH